MRKIKKGDDVIVLSGRDRGKRGTVLKIVGTEHLVIEGANRVKKHQRPNPMKGVTGGIIDKDMPIDASNVMIVCSECGPTRIGARFDEDGRKYRVCRKCGGEL